MQLTAIGPTTLSMSLGSHPPIWSRLFGLAHGPFVHAASGPVTSLPMKNRRFRPAHSATIIVLDVPSVIDAKVRCTSGFGGLARSSVWPSARMNCGSPVLTYWACWALTYGFGQLRSVVAA